MGMTYQYNGVDITQWHRKMLGEGMLAEPGLPGLWSGPSVKHGKYFQLLFNSVKK